ncbi:MAG: hypothetical protein ACPGXL_09045, partial [Chitinophagales bacterium]
MLSWTRILVSLSYLRKKTVDYMSTNYISFTVKGLNTFYTSIKAQIKSCRMGAKWLVILLSLLYNAHLVSAQACYYNESLSEKEANFDDKLFPVDQSITLLQHKLQSHNIAKTQALKKENQALVGLKSQWASINLSYERGVSNPATRAKLIKPIILTHGINKIERVFQHLPEMQHVYRFYFDEAAPIDMHALSKDLAQYEFFDYVEYEPIVYQQYTPNDVHPNQWYFDQIAAPEAWDIVTGSNEVTIAILDDAVSTTHNDLVDNIWQNPNEIVGDGVDNDGNGYVDDSYGWDAGDSDNDPNPPISANDF